MRFKDFINEMEEYEDNESSYSLQKDSINDQFSAAFEGLIPSPESGILQVSKILSQHGITMSAIYGLDPEGDEIVIDLHDNCHLYMIYSENDNGLYDFYAEVVDDEGLKEILEDEDTEEE